MKNGARSVALWLPKQQTRYWKEVFGECKPLPGSATSGPIGRCALTALRRVVLVERNPRDTIRKGLLLSPFSAPSELLKLKYRLSAPAHLALAIKAGLIGWGIFDASQLDRIMAVAPNLPGVSYAAAVGSSGMIASSWGDTIIGKSQTEVLIHILEANQEKIKRWAASGGASRLPRMEQFRKLGILADAPAEAELNALALQAYRKADQEPGAFAENLDKEFSALLEKNPRFSKYSPAGRAVLGLLFTPPLKVDGSADLELLARSLGFRSDGAADPLAALHSVGEDLPGSTLLLMAVETLQEPQKIEEKRKAWQKLTGTPAPSFINRPDVPELALALKDLPPSGEFRIKDETSLWAVIWTDPRMVNLKSALLDGSVSEVRAMRDAVDQIGAYDEIYSAAPEGTKPGTATFCRWLGDADGSPPSPLFSDPVDYYMGQLAESRTLSPRQNEGCRLDLAEFFFSGYMSDRKAIHGLGSPRPGTEIQSGLDRILSSCPASDRGC